MVPTRTIRSCRPIWPAAFDLFGDDVGRAVGTWLDDRPAITTAAYPVDIREDQNNLYVDAELPGFTKDDVTVTFEKGVLQINAERKPVEAEGQQHLNERHYTRVARSFSLPTSVAEDKIEARLENGVLYLTLPKREEVKPRTISVN